MKKLLTNHPFKTLFICYYCLLILTFIAGAALETSVGRWNVLATTSATGDEPTALATTERTYTTIQAAIAANASGDGKIVIHKVASGNLSRVNGMRFRCASKTATAVIAYDIYAGTLAKQPECSFTYVGTLSFTTGGQVSELSGYYFADAVAVTEGDTTKDFVSESPGDTTDRVAEAAIDLQGADTLVLVPKTVGADAVLFGKGW